MDVLTHALWPYAVTIKQKRWRWWAALWGMFPDLGVQPQTYYLFTHGMGNPFSSHINWETIFIPDSWMLSYRITHSFVTLAVVVGLYWVWKRRWAWPLVIGWGSHILLDMLTHSGVYSNRPLFPLSNVAIHGHNWSEPWIFFPNWIALALVYAWLGWRHWQRRPAVA